MRVTFLGTAASKGFPNAFWHGEQYEGARALGGPSLRKRSYDQFLEQVVQRHTEERLADDARVYAHHLAHHSHPFHPTLVTFAEQHGYYVAYDGVTLHL